MYSSIDKQYWLEKNLNNQLSRASISIVLNIAEGNTRYSKKDKARFMTIALGSASECLAVFDIIEDLGFLSADKVSIYRKRLEEIVKILTRIILNLKK